MGLCPLTYTYEGGMEKSSSQPYQMQGLAPVVLTDLKMYETTFKANKYESTDGRDHIWKEYKYAHLNQLSVNKWS